MAQPLPVLHSSVPRRRCADDSYSIGLLDGGSVTFICHWHYHRGSVGYDLPPSQQGQAMMALLGMMLLFAAIILAVMCLAVSIIVD
jgi:hypothetical protein